MKVGSYVVDDCASVMDQRYSEVHKKVWVLQITFWHLGEYMHYLLKGTLGTNENGERNENKTQV